MSLPTDRKARKDVPLFSGCLAYFPDALAAVAELSRVGNEQHNPGEPLHWSRGKSDDHADALARHLIESGAIDIDGVRHSTKVCWRALAMLQIELEGARSWTDPPEPHRPCDTCGCEAVGLQGSVATGRWACSVHWNESLGHSALVADGCAP